jgi:Flp pilus assembly protein TadG
MQKLNTSPTDNVNALKRRISAWRRWRSDRRGMAAIEFAMIFPVMVSMYMGSVEISQVLTLDRKITTITAATSDLVAQEKTIDDTMIADIFAAASSMIVPYDELPITIVVTSVVADPDDGSTTVDWSDTLNGTARTPGQTITVPAGLIGPGESLIYTEVTYQYDSIIGHFVSDGFTIDDEFYAKPRRTLKIIRE